MIIALLHSPAVWSLSGWNTEKPLGGHNSHLIMSWLYNPTDRSYCLWLPMENIEWALRARSVLMLQLSCVLWLSDNSQSYVFKSCGCLRCTDMPFIFLYLNFRKSFFYFTFTVNVSFVLMIHTLSFLSPFSRVHSKPPGYFTSKLRLSLISLVYFDYCVLFFFFLALLC